MSDTKPPKTEDKISLPMLVLAIALTVVATIAFLHSQDMLKHTESKDDYLIGDLKAVFIERQENQEYRVSHKPSNLSSACNDGYLFVVSDTNPEMQGIIVDYKNRGIKCAVVDSEDKESERPDKTDTESDNAS